MRYTNFLVDRNAGMLGWSIHVQIANIITQSYKMKHFSFVILLQLIVLSLFSQTGQYISIKDKAQHACKVFVDNRVIKYAGTNYTVTWTGSSKLGYAEGNGTLSLDAKPGSKNFHMYYTGALLKGKKQGKGELVIYGVYEMENYPPYFKYTGTFGNDDFNGEGKYIANWNAGSTTYNDPLWRYSTYFHQYEGKFIDGNIADTDLGKGTTRYLRILGDEVIYEGKIRSGKPNGRGVAYVNNEVKRADAFQSQYEGEFENGTFKGQGKLSTGFIEEEGMFSNNLLNGKGRKSFKVSNLANIPSAMFRYHCDVRTIEGDFKNDRPDGHVLVYYQDCDAYKYEGFMVAGIVEGSGQFDFINGDLWRSNFHNGKAEGAGIYKFANGTLFDGEFKSDAAVNGKLTYKDDSWYVGPVKEILTSENGKNINTIVPHGYGTMYDKNGQGRKVNCVDGKCNPAN